jgi:hypothetical protein
MPLPDALRGQPRREILGASMVKLKRLAGSESSPCRSRKAEPGICAAS